MHEPSIQKSLKHLMAKPDVSGDHLTVIAKSLVYGCEKAKMNFDEQPFSSDFAEALVTLAVNIPNEDLYRTDWHTFGGKSLVVQISMPKLVRVDLWGWPTAVTISSSEMP